MGVAVATDVETVLIDDGLTGAMKNEPLRH